MNDIQFTSSIRQALDESAQRLPWRVTHRLERARKAAIARVPVEANSTGDTRGRAEAVVPGHAPEQRARGIDRGPGERGADRHEHVRLPHSGFSRPGSGLAERPRARLAWRLAAVLVPAVVLVAGFVGFSELASMHSATEIATLETDVLADEVPISAYADRGFGVFLKNSRP